MQVPSNIIVVGLMALAGTGLADAPTPSGNVVYACCCPWSAEAGICPQDVLTFRSAADDICLVLDAEGAVSGYCYGDPDGVARGLATVAQGAGGSVGRAPLPAQAARPRNAAWTSSGVNVQWP